MLRTPVLGKGRKVKHHYKAFRTVLSMMVEFNLARQVLGVKHKGETYLNRLGETRNYLEVLTDTNGMISVNPSNIRSPHV